MGFNLIVLIYCPGINIFSRTVCKVLSPKNVIRSDSFCVLTEQHCLPFGRMLISGRE